MSDKLEPIYAGHMAPWTFEPVEYDNSAFDCSASTFSGVMRDAKTYTTRALSTAAFSTLSTGFKYSPVAADVGTAGYFEILISVEKSGVVRKIHTELEIMSTW